MSTAAFIGHHPSLLPTPASNNFNHVRRRQKVEQISEEAESTINNRQYYRITSDINYQRYYQGAQRKALDVVNIAGRLSNSLLERPNRFDGWIKYAKQAWFLTTIILIIILRWTR